MILDNGISGEKRVNINGSMSSSVGGAKTYDK